MSYGYRIIVKGDFACFSRPELKVERVSYDVPIPGALSGMLKGVYRRPAINYVIDKIIVFNPIDFINIRRNEVKDKVLLSSINSCMAGKNADPCICSTESRNQRASMLLKKGQCFRTQCLGFSEFPVRSITPVGELDMMRIDRSIRNSGDIDPGFMCYCMDFKDRGIPLNGDWSNPKFSDIACAVYYRPHKKGVTDVSAYREGLRC